MTAEEIKKVEQIVNEKIAENLAVETKEMTIEEAKQSGAMAPRPPSAPPPDPSRW